MTEDDKANSVVYREARAAFRHAPAKALPRLVALADTPAKRAALADEIKARKRG